jgi:hypothetical protein
MKQTPRNVSITGRFKVSYRLTEPSLRVEGLGELVWLHATMMRCLRRVQEVNIKGTYLPTRALLKSRHALNTTSEATIICTS